MQLLANTGLLVKLVSVYILVSAYTLALVVAAIDLSTGQTIPVAVMAVLSSALGLALPALGLAHGITLVNSNTAEAIKFDWNGRLIDGQHRLLAVVASGSHVRFLVVRGLAPDAQRYLDTGSKRSAADALRMAGELSSQNIVAAAARILISYEDGTLRTASSRAIERSNAEILDWYAGKEEPLASAALVARRVAKVTGAMTSVVTAFAYLISQTDPEAAFRFLDDIAGIRTTGKRDPRYKLILPLRSIRERGERTTQAQQLYYFLRAWNAWREKKPLHGMKDSALGTPVRIPMPR